MGIFDNMAARYDSDERTRVANIIADKIAATVENSTEKAALDYGCGTGLVGLPLAGCFRSLLLVDASPQMIEQVQRKIERMQLTNATTLCADFAADLLPSLHPNVIFMAQVLLHIPDTENILRRLYSLLPPGGQLLIADFDRNETIVHEKVHGGFVQADLIALVKQIGFARASAETFYHGQNLFMNQDASLFLLQAAKPA